MHLSLQNKTALICGGSEGLGLASAIALSQLGARIILLSRNGEKLNRALSLLNPTNEPHQAIVGNLAQPETVVTAIQSLLDTGVTIDILLNNAGGPPSEPLLETTAFALEQAFRMHVIAYHLITQTVAEGMKSRGWGRIINITSTSAKQPIPGLGISNIVRAAVSNWAKTMSQELGPFGITVNNVLPGSTKTNRLTYLYGKLAELNQTTADAILAQKVANIPARRLGTTEEFGAAIAFLASPAAAYINGINLPIDGGALLTL